MSEFNDKADHALSRKGRRYLDLLTRSHLATEDAVQALLNLVDPFPDATYTNVGYPGTGSVPTLPLRNLAEFTVSAPPGLAAGATWDLHLAILPITHPTVPGTGGTFTLSAAGAAVYTPTPLSRQMFTWVAYPTAAPVTIEAPAIATTSKGMYSPPSLDSSQAYRITSMGAELQNVSTQLYKGGAAYAYRQGMQKEVWSRTDAAFAANKMFRCHMISMDNVSWPADIVNFPNTWRGPADDGVVVVNTPSCATNESWSRPGYTLTHMGRTGATGTMSGNYTESAGEVSEWNSCGAFMTGLVQGASVVIRCSVGIEHLVNNYDATFVALSRSPVAASPELMEIFAKILRDLPAGFNYKDNPLGEWFDKILSMVADFAPRVGAALSPVFPAAGLIGTAIGTGAKAISGIKANTSRKIQQAKQEHKKKNQAGARATRQLTNSPHSSSNSKK